MLYLGKYVFRKFFILRNLREKRLFALSCPRRSENETIQEMKLKFAKALGQGSNFKNDQKPREHLMKYLPKTQEELPVRAMKDSFDSAIVPLSTDAELKDRYTTSSGTIRLGRLMEDMDLFAGYLVSRHCLYPNLPQNISSPIVVVTIAISHIDFLEPVKPNVDIRISGNVCWVGKSSLEVIVWMHQLVKGNWKQITRALFFMAARNSVNTGPALVNAVKPETKEEEELFEGGQKRMLERKKMMKESLLNTVPTEEELSIVHSLFIQTMDSREVFKDKKILPEKSKWMQDATLSNLVVCHPEHRNIHNKIFGGFLIRKALELSWVIAFVHGKKTPRLVHVSDVGFYNPVDVGSILKLFGSVTYTEKNYIQVFVHAEAYSSSDFEGKNTTVFNFTYELGKPVDKIFPSTYLEAMKYLDGRRHFKRLIDSSIKK